MRFFFSGWSHLVTSSWVGQMLSIGFSMVASPIFLALVLELVTGLGLYQVNTTLYFIDYGKMFRFSLWLQQQEKM